MLQSMLPRRGFEQLQSMKEFDNVDKMKVGATSFLADRASYTWLCP